MSECIFVSDLHGHQDRYQKLIKWIQDKKPTAVFIGGDILPGGSILNTNSNSIFNDFIKQYLIPEFYQLKTILQESYPQIFIIMGNDDPRIEEDNLLLGDTEGLWHYIHNRHMQLGEYTVFGYSYIPPTPFSLKDWERYDVSRFVDVGAVSPEAGHYTLPVKESEKRWTTIEKDLDELTSDCDISKAIFLFHAPPYRTNLDRANLDNKMIDHTPLDVHIGSIAIQRFIKNRQPLITLHGHVHESSRITGQWHDQIDNTYLYSAAYDGHKFAIICFDPDHPELADRQII